MTTTTRCTAEKLGQDAGGFTGKHSVPAALETQICVYAGPIYRHTRWNEPLRNAMRTKLILLFTIVVLVWFAVYSRIKPENVQFSYYSIALPLTMSSSTTRIEEQLHYSKGFVIKKEVQAGTAKYVFYQITPYYGYMIRVVYCYQKIKDESTQEEYLMLRGYFPVNYAQFSEPISHDKHVWKAGEDDSSITFLPEGNSVKMQIYGSDLFQIEELVPKIRVNSTRQP